MADSLLAAFSEALDLPPEQARPLLDQAIRLIGHRLDANEQAEVPGLGTFYRTGQGVRFVAAPTLEQAVNHRYAGLAPVSPPEQQPPAPPAPDEPEDPFSSAGAVRPFAAIPPEDPLDSPLRDIAPEPVEEPTPEQHDDAPEPADEPDASVPPFVFSFDEAPEDGPLEDEPSENASQEDEPFLDAEPRDEPAAARRRPDDAPLDPDDPDDVNALLAGVWTPRQPDAEPLGPMPDRFEDAEFDVEGRPPEPPPAKPEPASPPPAEPTPVEATPFAPPPFAAPPPAAPSRPIRAAEPAPFAATRNPDLPPEPPTPVTRPAPPPERRSALPYVLLGVLLLLLVGAAWWFLRPTPPPPTFAEAPRETPVEPTPTVEPPLADEPDDAATAPEAVEPEAPEPPVATEPTPAETPLRGSTPVTAEAGGYTWVVASEPSRADAERRAAAFREQGYRVGVIPGQVSGRTYYRVALGQYRTTDEAARFRNQLPDGAPPDTWRLRL